ELGPRQVPGGEFGVPVPHIAGGAQLPSDEMPEIPGEVQRERTGRVGEAGQYAPDIALVRVGLELPLKGAQLAPQNRRDRRGHHVVAPPTLLRDSSFSVSRSIRWPPGKR